MLPDATGGIPFMPGALQESVTKLEEEGSIESASDREDRLAAESSDADEDEEDTDDSDHAEEDAVNEPQNAEGEPQSAGGKSKNAGVNPKGADPKSKNADPPSAGASAGSASVETAPKAPGRGLREKLVAKAAQAKAKKAS
jgi:hypothetical protein